MRYLVMECGLSYAVVLDSEGRFYKVPNLGYEVGQTLGQVVLPNVPSAQAPLRKHLVRWAAMAACLCLLLFGGWGFWQSPIGTVRMQINPDVQMQVNRFDRVVGLEGLNADGMTLIDGYHAYGRHMQTVSDELADRAVDLGYLTDGGQITLTVESDRESWKAATEELLLLELDVHFEHRIIVAPVDADDPEEHSSEPAEEIVIRPEDVFTDPMKDNDGDYDDGNAEDDTDDDGTGNNSNDDDQDGDDTSSDDDDDRDDNEDTSNDDDNDDDDDDSDENSDTDDESDDDDEDNDSEDDDDEDDDED